MLNQTYINFLSEYNEPTREKKVQSLFPHAHFALFSAGAMQLRPPPQLSTARFYFFISWLPFGLQGPSQLEAARLKLSRRGCDGTDQRDQRTEEQEGCAALEWKLGSYCWNGT